MSEKKYKARGTDDVSGEFLISGILMALFILFTFLVRNVDVAAIGPEGTEVGFSHINGAVHALTGYRHGWYIITTVIGLIAIAVVVLMALFGLLQLIRRRSLFKVDMQIILLGCLYLAIFIMYVCFEKAIVNYRPVIMPGADAPEASYPSSHTVLVCTIMISLIMLVDDYIRNRRLGRIIKTAAVVLTVLMVIGRLLSGMHWFTDIVGGVLISAALLTLFSALKKRLC